MKKPARKTAKSTASRRKKSASDPMTPIPLPAQAPVTEGMAPLPGGTRLWYWDTGGKGQPVVFVHPASGSGLIWGYQQPAFAKAGYRVIGYSRRGFYKSDPISADDPGVGAEDLHHLIDHLGLDKFHVVASAAGGSIASEYAATHPERLRSLTISSNPCGVRAGYISDMWVSIRPDGWRDMPRWFWEVGPSYRAANPAGVKAWHDLEDKSSEGKAHAVSQKNAKIVTDKTLETMTVATLLMTGEADLATPPYVMRTVAGHVPRCKVVIVPEAGHSLYWERPDLFNRAVLDFISRQSGKARKAKKRKKA